jgi:hypothetical protein
MSRTADMCMLYTQQCLLLFSQMAWLQNDKISKKAWGPELLWKAMGQERAAHLPRKVTGSPYSSSLGLPSESAAALSRPLVPAMLLSATLLNLQPSTCSFYILLMLLPDPKPGL